jgi:PAS domain S-box-containing protein
MSRDKTGLSSLMGHDREEAFRRLVEGVQDYAIFMLSASGHIASWNAGAQRIKGYAAEEIIGQHFSRFYPREAVDAGWPDTELERAAELGRFEDEGWRLRKDGSRFWANVVITALRGASGELLGFSKVTRDLTERRLHEERLRHSEEQLRMLIEGAKDHALFMLDADGFVVTWNAGAQRMLGFQADEIKGRSIAILGTAEDIAAGKMQRLLAAAREGGHAEGAGWLVRRGGARFWADLTITLLPQASGQVRRFGIIVRDLSERRRAQELETEGRRLNEFIAMLAHELRNPLAPITSAAAVLGKLAHDEQLRWCATVIDRQVVHLSRLVDDLLDVSRITSGRIQLRPQPVELGALATAAVEAARPTIEQYEHALDLHLPGEPLCVNGDPTRLTQVMVNLLTNAAKYTPNGGAIGVRVERNGTQGVLRVIDNGLGMSQEVLDQAFELFFQGEQALDRSAGGLGIGLTLVKRIVQLHGGEVRAHSAGPGQGTEVAVSLPLEGAAALDEPTVAVDAVLPLRRRRVLVVDDNVDAAESMVALLRLSGHDVSVAHDGSTALRLASIEMPDVLVLDIGLPGMDGYAVARAIRGNVQLSHMRLIAMTGYGRQEDKNAAAEAGFNVHLVKPIGADDILRAISQA